MAFDPYHKWLGIPAAEQPADHYRLLSIARFESDRDVIEGAADRQMAHVRTFQAGPHSALSQRILNELAAAKLRLLDPQKKAAYDAELRHRLDAAQRPTPPVPIARPMAPVAVRAPSPTPVAAAEPRIAYDDSPGQVATRGDRDDSESSPVEITIMPARAERRLKPEHGGLALAAAGGLAVGFLLAWLFMSRSTGRAPARVAAAGGSRDAGGSAAKPDKSGSSAAIQPELATMLKSIARPSPLGVVAEKLVIWNAHSGPNNNVGTLECNVRLFAGGREVWNKREIPVPWKPNEDLNVTLALPPTRFDGLRVEITKWEKLAGALAEIQVLSADKHNLALGCPATSSGAWHGGVSTEHVTDGVTSTAETDVGAWLLPPHTEGWVEVDLSLPRPTDLHGVTAEKLVIWNQHNGSNNDFGALECCATLFAGGREVFRKLGVALPWERDQDRSLSLALPPVRFEQVRVEITKWERASGGWPRSRCCRATSPIWHLVVPLRLIASGTSTTALWR